MSSLIKRNLFIIGLILILPLILFGCLPCEAKWSKLPDKQEVIQPITGKFHSEVSSRYYNHPEAEEAGKSAGTAGLFETGTVPVKPENMGARIIKSSHFNLVYVLGHKIVFLCVAKGSPPPSITWFKDGVELFGHKYMQLHEWHFGKRVKSKMEIDPATQADAGIYECHANNKYAVDSAAFRTTYLAEFN